MINNAKDHRLKEDLGAWKNTILKGIGRLLSTLAGDSMRPLFLYGIVALMILTSTDAHALTASWYSVASCKKEGTSGITASGEKLNDNDFTAASWSYPFQSIVRVTNLNNGKSINVRINDRGPSKRLVKKGRVIDLSKKSFMALASLRDGVIPVRIEKIK